MQRYLKNKRNKEELLVALAIFLLVSLNKKNQHNLNKTSKEKWGHKEVRRRWQEMY
jgi:hypothetical protein